jgi:hypothetical protein
MTDDNKLRAAVERMFDDHSFKKVTNCMWLYGAVIDGIKVGVNEATHNPNFDNFTLNCKEFKRMIDAESSGRAGAVYVVKTQYDASTYKKRVIEVIEATALEKSAAHRRAPNWETRPVLDFARPRRRGIYLEQRKLQQ